MIVNEDKRICLLHVPRTGGTSRRQWLGQQPGWRYWSKGTSHVRLCDLRRFFGKGPDFFKRIIVVVRRPTERELSNWVFANEQRLDAEQFTEPMRHDNVNSYLSDWKCTPLYYYERGWHKDVYGHTKDGTLDEYAAYGGYRYWALVDGRIPENVEWVRMEEQDDMLHEITGQQPSDFPHLNASRHGAVAEEYTPDGLQLVRRLYWWTYEHIYSFQA